MSDLDSKVDELTTHVERLQAKHGHFTVAMPFGDAVIAIAHLQLALRHPGNKGYSSKVARRMVNDMIRSLDRASPGIGSLLRQGDDPSKDVPCKNINPREEQAAEPERLPGPHAERSGSAPGATG